MNKFKTSTWQSPAQVALLINFIKYLKKNEAWYGGTPSIPAFRTLKQEDLEVMVSLKCIAKTCFKNKQMQTPTHTLVRTIALL